MVVPATMSASAAAVVADGTREDRESEFARNERAFMQERIKRLDEIAEWRVQRIAQHHYYSEEVRRVVATHIMGGSRILEVGSGLGDLLSRLDDGSGNSVGIDCSPKMVALASKRYPHLDFRVVDVERDPLPEGPFDVIVLSDVVGHLRDVQNTIERLHGLLSEQGRLIVTYYNYVWEPVLKAAEVLSLKTRWPEQNWLSMTDIENLLVLSDFELVRSGTDILAPMRIPVVSEVANRVAAKLPVLREGALVHYAVARPITAREEPRPAPTVSVICPCKNEKGNIRAAIDRTPVMGGGTELIFVDGNSDDGTREEIVAQIAAYKGPLKLSLVDQGQGIGKGDAVRKGFAAASYDILMILDSDLTVPPEDLPKFYRALVTGKGEFINGVRLVYPMEKGAMRFLNLLGNKFFGGALSWLLEQPIKDSLCGTKVLYRRDYDRIAAERAFFGEFDPFGDFDLLFGASRLNLKIIDVPVRYRERLYGDTKISRFTHGWLLLKMTAFGFKKLRMGI